MPHCYILHSSRLNRFYIGATKFDAETRLSHHIQKIYGDKSFTANSDDWTLFLAIKTDSYTHALKIERKIKSMKSKKYIYNLKKFPEMLAKILNETNY